MTLSKMLFGEIALQKGLLTKEQVDECLEIQKKLKEMGITKTLGAVMHDKKYLSMVEIKEILREMTGTKDWNAIEGYQILEKLGKGGMGSVYKALHTGLNKLVALKVLPPDLAGDQEYLDRFWREARAAAKLNHPNIVQALDVGESFGYHYFVMEFVDGPTIKEMIDREKRVAEETALHVIAQSTEALIHAWKADMVHRDIKPSNIIVNKLGVAKLCDLGLAKSVHEDATITQTGVIMGTPFYLSPEQARNEDLDCRSDIYSLGVTLFHMLTGQVPFTGNTAATILYKHIFMEAPNVKTLRPELAEATAGLVKHMLAKAPGDRPENPQVLFAEVVAALREVAPERVTDDGSLVAIEIPEEPEPEPEGAPDEYKLGVTGSTSSSFAEAALSGAFEDAKPSWDSDELAPDLSQKQPIETGTIDLPAAAKAPASAKPREREPAPGKAFSPDVSGPARSFGPGVSGPTTADTQGTSSLTAEITAGMQAKLEPAARVESSTIRAALLAASLLGLVGLTGLVYTKVDALLAGAPAPTSLRVESLFGGYIRPEVQSLLAQAEERIGAQRFGEAAQVLAVVRQQDLSAAEEAALLKLQGRLSSEALDAYRRLDEAYNRIAADAGAADQRSRQLEEIAALGLDEVASYLETDVERLRELAVQVGGSEPEPEPHPGG